MGYSPAATVPKRLPDREISEKTKDNLRHQTENLGIDTGEFFPIRLPEVNGIEELEIGRKRQIPRASAKHS